MILMIACNDDNGNHRGRADAIEFEYNKHIQPVLRLEGLPIGCEMADIKDKGIQIRLSRRWFTVTSYTRWRGNICWDAARLTEEAAEEIANYLQSLKKFQCIEGEASLFNAWKSDQPIHFEKEG